MEVALFLVVGIIAIAAAVLMLLSQNAVHSALFLIVNFACVAFFYLMLDAPFLAMIQIAVYAGAIMVLFLFVIMLLGAEKLTAPTRQFQWLAPLAVALAAAFLLIIGVAIIGGQINLNEPLPSTPQVSVLNAAGDGSPVTVALKDQTLADNLAFGQSTDFQALDSEDPAELSVTTPSGVVAPASTALPEASEDQGLNTYTLVVYSDADGNLVSTTIPYDLQTTKPRTGRITVFNAYSEPVDLVSFGLPGDASDDRTYVDDLAPGASVVVPSVEETANFNTWAFTSSDGSRQIFPLSNPEVFSLQRDTSQLLVLTGEEVFDGSIRPVVIPVVTDSVASFGGPQAIGQLLFTRYMLPFQLIALLLLAAMIGAIVLTHKEGALPRRRDVRRVVSKPLADAIASQTGTDLSVPEVEAPQLPPEQQPEPGGD
jgi:NADH:ubiquinone oxidoreductase subunit 6 (subunit J)